MFKRITLVLVVLLFSSCVGSKKIVEESTIKKQTEKKEVKKDSSNVIEKNGAIDDSMLFSIPKVKTKDEDFNRKCTTIIDQLLKQVNAQKSSGANNYKLYYNLENRLLELQIKIAETQNQKTVTNNESRSETTFESQINSYVYKRITTMPWYLWVVIYFLLLDTKVAALLSNFIPGLKGATSILAIFKRR